MVTLSDLTLVRRIGTIGRSILKSLEIDANVRMIAAGHLGLGVA